MSCSASVASAGLLALVACNRPGTEPERHAPPPPRTTAAQQEEVDPKSLVKLRLVADGGDLAAVFEIEHGWHIYWINPGDSGLATRVEFSGPDGAAIGEPRFPGPIEFKSPGDIVSYGYEGGTAVFAALTDPPPSATFRVEASWLACAEVCVRGEGDAEVTVGETAPAAEPLANYRERLPRPLTDIGLSTRAGPTLLIPKTDVQYFPENDQAAELERVGKATRITLPSDAKGVLRVGDAYYAVP